MKYCTILVVFAMLLASGACSKVPNEKTAAGPAGDIIPVATILVLPVELPLTPAQQEIQANQLEAGQATLNDLFAEYFEGMKGAIILSQSAFEGMNLDPSGSQTTLARQIGRQMGVDAVMTSTIKRYIRRDVANSRFASVSFEYTLLAVETGQVLCGGDYDVTQQPLFENIFSLPKAIHRKFQWITARELAKEGVVDKLGSCSYLRRDSRPAP